MKKENKFLQWLKRPRGVFLVLVYILTVLTIAASVTLVVLSGDEHRSLGVIAYILFGLAAMLLAFTVYTIVIYAPIVKNKIVDKLKSFKFTANLLENYGFKTMVFALISFAITIAFATMNLVSAIRYRLIWYAAISAYYFILTFFRGGTLLADRKCRKKYAGGGNKYEMSKWRIYLSGGAFLTVLEFAMAAAVTQLILSGRPTRSGEIMAISSAAYTFYKMIMAVYNLFKARKFSDPVAQSLRNLNFADACMSVVSLTVLMIATFDDGGSTPEMLYVKAIVGFAACAIIIAMAAVMIITAAKKLNALKNAPDPLPEPSEISRPSEAIYATETPEISAPSDRSENEQNASETKGNI